MQTGHVLRSPVNEADTSSMQIKDVNWIYEHMWIAVWESL